MNDDELRSLLRSGDDPAPPDGFREALRSQLVAATREYRHTATSGRTPGNGAAGPDHTPDAELVPIDPGGHGPGAAPARGAAMRRRLAWAAAAVVLAGCVGIAIARHGATDDDSVDASRTSAIGGDPVVAATDACEAFASATASGEESLEVLVSNGPDVWSTQVTDPVAHLETIARAGHALAATLRDLPFAHDQRIAGEAAADDFESLAEVATALVDTDPDLARTMLQRIRDPLVRAAAELATIGVRGCL